jgi:hypothetical protein
LREKGRTEEVERERERQIYEDLMRDRELWFCRRPKMQDCKIERERERERESIAS